MKILIAQITLLVMTVIACQGDLMAQPSPDPLAVARNQIIDQTDVKLPTRTGTIKVLPQSAITALGIDDIHSVAIKVNKVDIEAVRINYSQWKANAQITFEVTPDIKRPAIVEVALRFKDKSGKEIPSAVIVINKTFGGSVSAPSIAGTGNLLTASIPVQNDGKFTKMLVAKVRSSKTVKYYDHAPAETAMLFSAAFAKLADHAHTASASPDDQLEAKGAELQRELRSELDMVYARPGVKLAWKPILVDVSNQFYKTVPKDPSSGQPSVSLTEAADIFKQLSDGFDELHESFTEEDERIAVAKAAVLGTNQSQPAQDMTRDRKRSSGGCFRLLLGL